MGSKHFGYDTRKTLKNITTHTLYTLTSVMTVFASASALEMVGNMAPTATRMRMVPATATELSDSGKRNQRS